MVNFFGEAAGLQRSAVIGLVVVLLAFTAIVNIGGQLLLRQRSSRGRVAERDPLLVGAGGAPT